MKAQLNLLDGTQAEYLSADRSKTTDYCIKAKRTDGKPYWIKVSDIKDVTNGDLVISVDKFCKLLKIPN